MHGTDARPFLVFIEAISLDGRGGPTRLSTDSDRAFIDLALAEAARCVAESGHISPKVGAVAVQDGHVLATAFRGEHSPGEHAEYGLLERHLSSTRVAGATVYTTIEPCSVRAHPKLSCAQRLIERGIRRVVVGLLDPDPRVRGRGLLTLRQGGVKTELFPPDSMQAVESQNAAFIGYEREGLPEPKFVLAGSDWKLLESKGFVAGRSQRDWYEYFLATDDLASLETLRRFYTPPTGIESTAVAAEFLTTASDIVVDTDVRILKAVAADPKRLLSLTPREFELFTAELLKRLGYSNVLIGRGSKDGGVDVTAYIDHPLGVERVIVQCKRHAPEHKVGEPIIKQLLADVDIHRAARGLIATTSYLTKGARLLVEQLHYRLSALDHEELCRLLRETSFTTRGARKQ
jgi:pyrimidine deaminase RibD-like protein